MDSPGNRRAITLNIYWKWCLSSLKGFVIPGRAEYEDFLLACNAVARSLRTHALVSRREIPIFRKPETGAKHRGV